MRRALSVMPMRLAVVRLPADAPLPAWLFHQDARFLSLTRTAHETSVVCDEDDLPPSITQVERGWRGLALEGPIPFGETGVLASLVGPLAGAGIPVFAISTYDTDVVLVREADLSRALDILRGTFTIG